MGTVFQVPFGKIGENKEDWPERGMEILRKHGFKTVSMALLDDTLNIDSEILAKEERLAIILGTEGTGLAKSTIESSDYTVKIPMSGGVDSLNVGAAGAVAFWELAARGREIRR
jgi:tRNA G18 (ribose-2'-O)-methylase SpoU